jgi:histidine triad (HIT) family protein
VDCVFCQIVEGKIPAKKLHEDELAITIRDIRTQAPTHVLVMPKAHVGSLAEEIDEKLGGRLLRIAAEIARSEKLADGWRLIVNTGAHGGQEVPHLHLHVIGGRKLGRMLPPG